MAEIRHEIIYYTVLMMLALLVPIPFVDDVLKNYLRRRMIERLARNYQCELSELEVKVLARENGEGCLSGCLMRMLFYPIKKLFRKMFFLWGWKKALDEASYTLHYAVLLDYSMQEGWLGPQGRYEVSQVRCYIEAVLREVDTKPLEAIMRAAFVGSKEVVREAVVQLSRRLKSRKRAEESMAETLQLIESRQDKQINNLVDTILDGISKLPASYLVELKTRLRTKVRE